MLSVDALHERLAPVEPAAVAVNPAGVEGGVVSAADAPKPPEGVAAVLSTATSPQAINEPAIAKSNRVRE